MKLRELLSQLKEVQQNIGASDPYICGGTPRDKAMGRLDNIADIDLTTGDKTIDYLSQEFAIILRRQYNVTRKTMEDGHSTIFIGNLKIDFSSNFVVNNVDKYLAQKGIAKPTDMQREMFSRDFTCNSLLMNVNLKQIIDPTKEGFRDIKEKKIRTCLSPEITLTTNRNRVARAIYLASKLNFDIDDSIVQYVQKNPQSVKISTTKALNEKLSEAFKRDADRASFYITKMGLWDLIPVSTEMYPYYLKNTKGKTNVR
jgi:poly(A) polymerase